MPIALVRESFYAGSIHIPSHKNPPPLRSEGAGLDRPGRSRTTPVVPRRPGTANTTELPPSPERASPRAAEMVSPFQGWARSHQAANPGRRCTTSSFRSALGCRVRPLRGVGGVPWGGGLGLGIPCGKTGSETALNSVQRRVQRQQIRFPLPRVAFTDRCLSRGGHAEPC